MDQIDSRPAHSPEPSSDDAASPCHLPARDRGDLLDFEPAPLRRRSDGLTPEKQRQFVEALADTGLIREAAARIGVTEQSVNRVRRRADAVGFDRACEAAHMFGARRLRSVAFERAVEGTVKGRYYHGERVGEERVYDNRLLIYLLGKTEHLLEPPRDCKAICDNWDAHMDALEQGVEAIGLTSGFGDPRDSQVWEDEETGMLLTSFPPPDGFDGQEQGVWDGVGWYCRTLTQSEQEAMEERRSGDIAEARAREGARRDLFFGFAGDGNSRPGEAEPSEPSEPSGEVLGPIEYKSLVPPTFRRRAEAVNAAARRLARPTRHPGAGREPAPKASAALPEVPARARMTTARDPSPRRRLVCRSSEPFPRPGHSLDSAPTGDDHGRVRHQGPRGPAAADPRGDAAMDLGDGTRPADDARACREGDGRGAVG